MATFKAQMLSATNKAQHKASWVLRTFSTRNPKIMTTLWKSLVQPNYDYCSQLWSPVDQIGPLRDMEEPLKAFTRRVAGCYNLTYWERLERLNLTSIQRRFGRYKILYTWKSLAGLVPSLGLQLAHSSDLRGRLITVPIIHGSSERYVTLMEKSLKIEGSKLFNAMPKYIRNLRGSKDQFKENLDRFLANIPDQPRTKDLVPHSLNEDCQPTNSLKYWVKSLSLQHWTPTNQRTESNWIGLEGGCIIYRGACFLAAPIPSPKVDT